MTDDNNAPGWLSRVQAARYLDVSPNTIDRWRRDGVLPAGSVPGGHWRYRRGDLDRVMQPTPAVPSDATGLTVDPGRNPYYTADSALNPGLR